MTVLIGGFFDIVHSGHVMQLETARAFGDRLVVCVSPDTRAREKKGKGRPILSEHERRYVVQALSSVDSAIVVSAEEGMSQLEYQKKCVACVRPDIFLTGSYHVDLEEYCRNLGCALEVVHDIIGIDRMHSTDIINKVKAMT